MLVQDFASITQNFYGLMNQPNRRESIMPIYEYQCQSCQHQFDKLQKMRDAPLVDCPECHQAKLKKLVSAPSFRLKGEGWYETDFKTKKKPESNAGTSTDKPAVKKTDGVA